MLRANERCEFGLIFSEDFTKESRNAGKWTLFFRSSSVISVSSLISDAYGLAKPMREVERAVLSTLPKECGSAA